MASTQHNNRRWEERRIGDVGLGRMFAISLGLHLIFLVFFLGPIFPRFDTNRRPIYYVDLVHLPVQSPQAGRPDAPPPRPLPEPKPITPPKSVAVPEKKASRPSSPSPKAVSPPEEVVAPEPPPRQSYDETLSAIDALKRKAEREALKKKMAAIAANAALETPAGMPEGKGPEIGVDQLEYIKAFIRGNWQFSIYQISPAKAATIEAVVYLKYDRAGNLFDYGFIETSDDKFFDESLREAILKSKSLPHPLGNLLEVTATFNLKDMMDGQAQ